MQQIKEKLNLVKFFRPVPPKVEVEAEKKPQKQLYLIFDKNPDELVEYMKNLNILYDLDLSKQSGKNYLLNIPDLNQLRQVK